MSLKLIFIIYLLIAISGTLVAEAIKKMYKGVVSFNTKESEKSIKFNPIIIYLIVGAIDIISSIVFTIFGVKALWALGFAPVLVFASSIVGYHTIIKNIINIFDSVGILLKRFIVGNTKEIEKDKSMVLKETGKKIF